MAARRGRHLSSCETYLDAELGVVQRRMGVPDSGCVLLGDRYARRSPLVLRATSGRHELDSNVLHGPSLGPVPRAERQDSPRLEYLQRMERAERHPGEFHPGLVHPLVDLHLDGPPQALYPHLTPHTIVETMSTSRTMPGGVADRTSLQKGPTGR